MDERRGAGGDAVAGLLQRVQVLGGHVLVVEGEHGGAVGQVAERVQVVVGADPHVRGDQRGGLLGAGAEHPQRLAERDGGLVRHARQLPPPTMATTGRPVTAERGAVPGMARRA